MAGGSLAGSGGGHAPARRFSRLPVYIHPEAEVAGSELTSPAKPMVVLARRIKTVVNDKCFMEFLSILRSAPQVGGQGLTFTGKALFRQADGLGDSVFKDSSDPANRAKE